MVTLLIGTVLGFLSGLGVGGGSLLLLWLTVVLDYEPQQAALINLLFFLPGAAVSTVLRRKQGTLEIRKLLPAILAACITAAAAAWLRPRIHTELLKKLFGALLIATGLRELLTKDRRFTAS